MSLPTANTEWPPKVLKNDVLPHLTRWSAWYSGSPHQLEAAYGGGGKWAPHALPIWRDQPTQWARDGAGTMAHHIWGKLASEDQEVRLHVPIAGDISAMSANLLFGEAPKIAFGGNDRAGTQFVEDLIEDGLWSRLRQAAEIQSALGGVYLRAVWDQNLRARAWTVPVHPDVAVPEWAHDRLRAVTFWEIVWQEGNTVWRHLERHEPGYIIHGMYRGTPQELGERVAFRDAPAEGGYLPPDIVDGQDEGVIPTGLDDGSLTAWYVPNILPNRIWRNVPTAANWGRSDYSGVEDAMAALDVAWTSWMRDIRLGKARLIMDRSALSPLAEGKGAFVDLDKELYVGMNLGLDVDKVPIEQVQFAIRVEEHARTCDALREAIIQGAGYSMITFTGETEGAAVTATEIQNKAKRTLMTQDMKRDYWDSVLPEVVVTLARLQSFVFGDGADLEVPNVEWPESVQPGQLETAQTIAALDAAKAISAETKVRMFHPDWDDKRVAEEVQAISGLEDASRMAEAVSRFNTASALGDVDEPTRSAFRNRLTGPVRGEVER